MAIVSLDDVTGVKTAAPLPDVPIFRHLPASEVKVVWKCTAEALDAANAGVAMYNKRMRPIVNLAEQRHIAGLYDTSDAALGSVNLDDILEDPLALPFVKKGDAMADSPFTWRYSRRGAAGGGEDAGAAVGGGAGAGAGAGAHSIVSDSDSDSDSSIEAIGGAGYPLKTRLKTQWGRFIARANLKEDPMFVRKADKQQPGEYWVRMRINTPDLSEIMLLWLTNPLGSVDAERGFSFMTAMDSNARRRRMKEQSFRATFMAHLYREWLMERLSKAMARR